MKIKMNKNDFIEGGFNPPSTHIKIKNHNEVYQH